MSQQPFFHGASAGAFENARRLRKNMTPAEQELWKYIRKDQINGFRFRRQHPVAQFILDFYCHESRLAIEVDGLIHEQPEQRLYDQQRERIIEELGIKVLRFKNEELFKNLNRVLDKIRTHLTKPSPVWEDLGGVNSENEEDLGGVKA